ncbi:ABC transporter ATP-binding protein [Subtercola lobariae]|uniref:ABC transporter domain-containing protein n=1 Tax=Subtercola lobariae TaxID=1588641 RepID=A0A917BAP0_9MICO|nr:ATP-binding cassette domain-containing protein [Subtercola lobariae]GGF31614.1 hypothetical protein GCM10011399_25990 [Subtercola lobariae]
MTPDAAAAPEPRYRRRDHRLDLPRNPRPTSDPTLRLVDVTIEYPSADSDAGPITIVSNFGLDVLPGVMHCLAGRSGSGKTSLLKVAAGLIRPTSGDVFWRGDAITKLSDDAISTRRRGYVGYLDQGGVLVSGLSALENVLLPAVPTKQTKSLLPRATDLLESLGVASRSGSRPEKLSGGERQRVALARALLLSPAILMVDEPTASLDRRSADTVIDLLRSVTSDGTSVLVSAHDPHLIAAADSRTELA